MRVHNIYFVFFEKKDEPTKLRDEIAIIKGVERIFGNLSRTQTLCFGTQRSFVLQACEMHAASALPQETHKLQCLALGAALFEAVYDVKDVWVQSGFR